MSVVVGDAARQLLLLLLARYVMPFFSGSCDTMRSDYCHCYMVTSTLKDWECDAGSCGDVSDDVNISGFLVAEYRRRDAADGYSSDEVAREHAVKKRRLRRQLCAAVVVCSAKLMEAYVK